MAELPAPALSRGIRVLRLLGERPGMSLEDIHHATGLPKSSLTRLLATLGALHLVRREADGHAYTALARLTPVAGAVGRQESLARALRDLACSTGLTAEWYVPGEEGMILTSQTFPPDGEVYVKARAGYVRSWEDELDAVCCVGRAFFRGATAGRKHTTYTSDGVHSPLNRKAAADRVRQALASGASVDPHFNANGVRRVAVALRAGEKPEGVLALAQFSRPGARAPESLLACLLTAANDLGRVWAVEK